MKKWIFLLLIAPMVSAMAPNETMNHIGNKFFLLFDILVKILVL